MLDARRTPHDVAGPNLPLRTAFFLCPADALRHDQVLAGRMRVPCRAGTGCERHVARGCTDVIVGAGRVSDDGTDEDSEAPFKMSAVYHWAI